MTVYRFRAAILCLCGTLLLGACGSAPFAFGPTSAAARTSINDLFGALALRFGPLERSAKLNEIRPRLVRHALSPSRIHDDSAMWSQVSGRTRVLMVGGSVVDGRYTLAFQPRVPAPERAGESRATITLTRLPNGDFSWTSADELGIGEARSGRLTEALVRAFAAVEGHDERRVRAAYRLGLPRTTAALARLFSLDTLIVTAQPDGATAFTLGVRMDPKRLRRTMRHFADYLDEYYTPARYRYTLLDRQGAHWLDVAGERNLIRIRFRTKDGVLVPLDAPPRPLPDSLHIRAEMFAKVLFFTVGATELVGDFTIARGEHERGARIRFRKEPVWHLPLATEHLLRSPLRRPFEGDGVRFDMITRDSPGMQTVLRRDIHATVRESAIVRWLGALGNQAMGDVTRQVELEKDTFFAELFRAMQADLRGALEGGD